MIKPGQFIVEGHFITCNYCAVIVGREPHVNGEVWGDGCAQFIIDHRDKCKDPDEEESKE